MHGHLQERGDVAAGAGVFLAETESEAVADAVGAQVGAEGDALPGAPNAMILPPCQSRAHSTGPQKHGVAGSATRAQEGGGGRVAQDAERCRARVGEGGWGEEWASRRLGGEAAESGHGGGVRHL